jgi:hypothetical protein
MVVKSSSMSGERQDSDHIAEVRLPYDLQQPNSARSEGRPRSHFPYLVNEISHRKSHAGVLTVISKTTGLPKIIERSERA